MKWNDLAITYFIEKSKMLVNATCRSTSSSYKMQKKKVVKRSHVRHYTFLLNMTMNCWFGYNMTVINVKVRCKH